MDIGRAGKDRIVCIVPVAGEDRGRPCWLRRGSEYKRLVPATLIGGQPSQGTASASADRASWDGVRTDDGSGDSGGAIAHSQSGGEGHDCVLESNWSRSE